MYAPHTVTLFNVWEDANLAIQSNITILHGVFLDTDSNVRANQNGLSDSSSAVLYIPMDVLATATTGVLKHYIAPYQFTTASTKTNLWTLDSGGESNSTSTYFARGEHTTYQSLAQLKAAGVEAFDVVSVKTRDYGSKSMQHWQVSGA